MDVVFLFRLKSVHLLPVTPVWKKLVLLLLLLQGPSFPFKGQAIQTKLPLYLPPLGFVPGDTLLARALEMKKGMVKISLSLNR